MSHVGKQPIVLPSGVNVRLDGSKIEVKGPKGVLSFTIPEGITVDINGDVLRVKKMEIGDRKRARKLEAFYGLTRAIVNNMVIGVSQGFTKNLEIIGVGYRARVDGKTLVLNLGYSHPINFPIPDDVSISVEGNIIKVEGISKERVGQIAANIRAYRPPEPYKGKGIRYVGEYVIRKVGKAAT